MTPAGWERHLAGEEGLVVTPVRPDGTCWFGAIDVDVYPLDAAALVRAIAERGYPLVCCRTKSGGAHAYLFLAGPGPAARMRDVLRSWASALGYPSAEVFPKQVSLAGPDDLGSGLNLPYFGATRPAVGLDGELDLTAFLAAAELARTNPAALEPAAAEGAAAVPDELRGAPPCLLHWAAEGVPEGRRNETMFDFAVYCRKRYGTDDWRDRFEELNRRYCSPPLAAPELLAIYKSVAGRTYTYKCHAQGDLCDRKACRTAEYGMGGGFDEPNYEIGDVVVVLTTPKQVIVTINGRNVEFAMGDLLDQRAFQAVVWEAIEMIPRPVKTARWAPLVEGWLARAERVRAPEDASAEGQLLQHVEGYRRRYPARSRDELRLDGRAWYDDEERRLYFRSRDLLAHLRRERVGGWTAQTLYQTIRKLGGGPAEFDLAGERTAVWWLPLAPESERPVDAPSGADAGGDEVPF